MKILTTSLLAFALLVGVPPLVNRAEAAPQAQNASAIIISRAGERPAKPAPAEHFTGSVQLQPVFAAKAPGRTSAGSVTFQPGARSAWHTHPFGQALIITAGTGWVQSWGGPVEVVRAGDVVQIPAGVKHWHGAAATTAMTHIAVQEEIDGKNVDWLEKVTDEQYGRGLTTNQKENDMKKEPSSIQKQIGDFAPKMADLTDKVLFGDIWERTAELAPRDRSLITVAALTVGGNAEQLPFHLNKAKENGLSESEIVEALTHLAFYTGWPRALSAINVAKATFQKPPTPPSQEK